MESVPINLLVLAEEDEFQNNFICDLRGYLHSGKYKPVGNIPSEYIGITTTFCAFHHIFCIISGPVILAGDTSENIFSKFFKFQNLFLEPINLNAIIFLIRPDPRRYEHFLSLNLFTNFSKANMKKIEKNVLFFFIHDDPVSCQKRDIVDAELWTVLDRIGADLLHSKTFHYHSRLDKDCQNAFLQFIYKNKRTLLVKTKYSNESISKVVGNEEFLDCLMYAFVANESNIQGMDLKLIYVLKASNVYQTICTGGRCFPNNCYCSQIETKLDFGLHDGLKNESAKCKYCGHSLNLHKGVKFGEYLLTKSDSDYHIQNNDRRQKNRCTLVAMMVAIDLFHKEFNTNVRPLYDRLKEIIDQESSKSVLETMYKNEMDSREEEITADDCIKCVRKSLSDLVDFIKDSHLLIVSAGKLQVKSVLTIDKTHE